MSGRRSKLATFATAAAYGVGLVTEFNPPEPSPKSEPREQTNEDRRRLLAAELKRARKNARRLGFTTRTVFNTLLWNGTALQVIVSPRVLPGGPREVDCTVYDWAIWPARLDATDALARGDCKAFCLIADEAELDALRALPAVIESLSKDGAK